MLQLGHQLLPLVSLVGGGEGGVEFGERGNQITIEKAKPKKGKLSRGERIVARATGTGSVNLDLTTDQIMALTRGWGEDDFDR